MRVDTVLTEQEREVVIRAAAGMTDREIAEALRLPVEEVKRRLLGVYEKLGVHSQPTPPGWSA